MRQETDYILRLIEQLGAMIRAFLGRSDTKEAEEPGGLGGEALGLVLSLDSTVASKLVPRSLAKLLELSETDERVMAHLQQALEIEAGALEDHGDVTTAMLRRDQAEAVRSALGARVEEFAGGQASGADVSCTSEERKKGRS